MPKRAEGPIRDASREAITLTPRRAGLLRPVPLPSWSFDSNGDQREGAVSATLARVCADLAPPLLEIAVAPRGLEVPVSDVALQDPTDPPAADRGAGDIILAVGAEGGERTERLLRAAGRAGAAAIICKPRDGAFADRMLAVAEDAGVALLATAAEVAWGELYGLLRASIATDDASELPRGTGAGLADIFALADAAAAMTGGAVTVEDTRGALLGYSREGGDVDRVRKETVLNRQAPADWMTELRRQGLLDALMTTADPIAVALPELRPRRAAAIRVGGSVLGFIWTVQSPDGDPEAIDLALREAARIAALHLMRRRVVDDLDRRVSGGMLQLLLRGDAEAASLLERLGHGDDDRFTVVALDPYEVKLEERERFQRRLMDLLVMHLKAYRWSVTATAMDDRVYLLVAVPDADGREGLIRTLQDALKRVQSSMGIDLRAGIGQPTGDAEDLPRSRRSAEQAIDLGAATDAVTDFDQVHARALLSEFEGFFSRQRLPLSPEVEALIERDRERGSVLTETLLAYLEALGDAGVAAARLGVHVNTFRYRMHRVIEISGIDLADPDTRLAVEMQLRVMARR